MTSLTKPTPITYANPSWTMAITAKPSALSRWWGKSLSQVSSFTLHLKGAEASLAESSDSDSDEALDVSNQPLGQSVAIQGTQAQLEGFAQLTEQYVQSWLGRSFTADHPDALEPPSAFWNDAPEWQSTSGYSHRLSLGALNVDPILRELKVSTTQLYDLAEILQQSVAEVQPVSASSGFARTLPERSPSWGKTAAVATIALSLTGGLAWVMGGESVFQTASDSEPDELVSLNSPQERNPAESPINLPPAFPAKPTKPVPQGKQSKTSIAKKVTPPKVGEQTVNANVDNAIAPQKPSPSASAKSSGTENKASSGSKSLIAQDSLKTSQSSKTPAKTSKPSKLSDAEIAKDARGDQPKAEPDSTTPSPKPVAKPAPTVEAIAETPPVPSTSPNPVAAAPPGAPEAATLQSRAKAANTPPESLAGASPNSSDFSIASESSRRVASPVSAAPVLRFFQSQWKGQDSLKQSLLYSIAINPDGSVRSVTPKNDAASTQFSQTPLPSPGDPLMSPFSGPNVATFEVMLYPDGTVSVK